MLLGFSPGSVYDNIEHPLKAGDEIYMFTDGITEARNKEGKMLEEEGIIDIIKSINPDENQIEKIQHSFKEYTSNEFDDDLSLIAIRVEQI